MKPSCFYCSVTVNFIDRDGDTVSVKAKLGDTVQEVASDNDVELECKWFSKVD